MDEKTSMMAHSDVFSTVYSTMCVECAIHDRPIVSVVIDSPGGWKNPDKFSLALTEIERWPTHSRFLNAGAGRLAANEEAIIRHFNAYLADPTLDKDARQKFVKDEITYTDGAAGIHTADYLLTLLNGDSN
jgi:CDP-glycerol glycerophosphotransferase (TagB/SpsB family)